MTGGQVAFVDIETSGLHPDKHQIWEVGLITPDGAEHVWQFPINEMQADPYALQVGRYWERRWSPDIIEISALDAIYEAHTPKSRRERYPDQGRAIKPSVDWCRHFQKLTAGCQLAGAVISFDEERLRRLLHQFGVLHRWDYHLIDVEALAIGYIIGHNKALWSEDDRRVGDMLAPEPRPPWRSGQILAALDIHVADNDKHTAIGDARWARSVYEKVMS